MLFMDSEAEGLIEEIEVPGGFWNCADDGNCADSVSGP
jgi:hypothetical protein